MPFALEPLTPRPEADEFCDSMVPVSRFLPTVAEDATAASDASNTTDTSGSPLDAIPAKVISVVIEPDDECLKNPDPDISLASLDSAMEDTVGPLSAEPATREVSPCICTGAAMTSFSEVARIVDGWDSIETEIV